MNKNRPTSMTEIFHDPKFRGKHVILVAGKVYTAVRGKTVEKILEKLEKKYPKQTPEYAYIPKGKTAIV